MTRLFVVLVALALCSSAIANPRLCPPQKIRHSGEGIGGPVAEEAFTEERARSELKRLQDIMAPGGVGADAMAWENAFVYIEGWFLKQQALLPANERSPTALADFCSFMKTRAHLRD